jgi:hypothetical protein
MTETVATLSALLGLDDRSRAEARSTALARGGRFAASKLIAGPLRLAAAAGVIDASVALLQSPLAEILGDAWSKAREIAKYADPNKYPPDAVNEVALGGHEIALKRKPSLEIVLDGAPTGVTVPCELKLKLELKSVMLRIQGGRIVGARVGDFLGGGSYACAGVTLAERKTSPFRLPGDVVFNPGVIV